MEPDDYRNYSRMDENTYVDLLNLVTPLIQKNKYGYAAVNKHLSATFQFLATERNYEDLKFTTNISEQCLGIIIPETCGAICKVLYEKYMKVNVSCS